MAEEQNPQNPVAQPTTQVPPPNTPNPIIVYRGEKPLGPIAGIVIIVGLLTLGGFYFWGQRLAKEGWDTDGVPSTAAVNQSGPALKKASSSDSVQAMQNDLDKTNLKLLDQSAEDINSALH